MTRRPATNVPALVARLPLRRPSCVTACLLLAAALLLAGPAAAAPLWEPVGDVRLGFGDLQMLPGEPPVLLAVRDGSLWRLASPSGSWEEVPVPAPATSTDDQGFTHVVLDPRLTGLWVAPRDPDLWLVEFRYRVRIEFEGNPITEFDEVQLRRTVDGGETWHVLTGGLPGALAIAPSRPGLVYLATVPVRRGDQPVARRIEPESETSGAFFPPEGNALLRGFAVDAADPDRVYTFHSHGRIYVSPDGGESWTEPFLPAAVRVVAAHPSIPGTALAAGELGTIWRTQDGGTAWHELTPLGFAGGETTQLVIDPVDPGRYYAVHDGVVFLSDNGGLTWRTLGDGLPVPAAIGELVLDPGDPSRLFATLAGDGAWAIDRLFPAEPCVPDERTLCLGDGGRFAARVLWQDPRFAAGPGRAVPRPGDDSGAFWFFRPDNLELVVKALDGRPVNGFRWVFYGSLTNVRFTLVVTDTATGETVGYFNPLGNFASRGDTEAFPEGGPDVAPPPGVVTEPVATTVAPASCVPDTAALCLAGARFRVEVEWDDFQGGAGFGTAVPATDDTGLFWFFRDGNLELAVKVLDGRPVNGHRWVFYGSLTSVEFHLRVTDTATGEVRIYENPSGNLASRGDTAAFPDAP